MSDSKDEARPAAEEILEAWRTNHRINVLILEALSPEALRCTLSTRGGRDVARQFAHVHNNRVQQLENRRAKALAEGLVRFESKYSPTAAELIAAMEDSTEAVGRFLVELIRDPQAYRGFKKGVFTTLSYLIGHEAHHRGSILLTLKQSGHAVPKEVAFGIWDWDRR